MAEPKPMCSLLDGAGRLTIVQTDLVEAEELIRRLAAEAEASDPRAFAGKKPCVYFKFPYVPPCESFKELRRLILQVREATGLRSDFRGIVAIEATEWLGHEREEYFCVVLKYLYDHRHHWYPAMVLKDCHSAQAQRFAAACAVYITPRLVNEQLFTDPERLSELLRAEVYKRGSLLQSEASQLVAQALAAPALAPARSLTLLERVAGELIAFAPTGGPILPEHAREYLKDPFTTLTMLAGTRKFEQRSDVYAAEILQL